MLAVKKILDADKRQVEQLCRRLIVSGQRAKYRGEIAFGNRNICLALIKSVGTD